ncbi:SAM hydrolase/SAM-dependent halogenase family protein [Rubrobacter indicoceani]|uniref:SAM hydrolase/SAM-dependent halogenase family protein n=1 Tax=Rubrobacter indicoceani TaxID=2051957 RepID=UPI000E5B24EF|nr:SAM-dependent chlorinase/fluorinase [Rubrobacter indicoceani]
MRPICFLSDFGLADDFVGTCRGVIFRIAPEVRVIDLTHSVPSFGIRAGAELLEHATRYMPEDTVYLAVVDPGVGTSRREIALETESGAMMVGPDNGLLMPAAASLGGVSRAACLTNDGLHVKPVSSTFHGRDVFSPVAAYLASGTEFGEVGDPVDVEDLTGLDLPDDEMGEGDIRAQIMDVDRFGNARLSIREEGCGLRYGEKLALDVGDGDMEISYVCTFGSATSGELILVPDSHWRLSVAINKGNAARALALEVGSKVTLRRKDD